MEAMLRSAALILFASALAWTQAAAPPPGCANLTRTSRPDPYESPEQKDKKGLKQRVKDQFSSGCVNVLIGGCWGNEGQKPPENVPGTPETKGQTTTTTESRPQSPDKPAPQAGTSSSSKKGPDLEFPEEQSRRAQEAAQGVSSSRQGESSSRQPSNPSPADSDVLEMKPYDPHKAEKDIEVGDFYYKRGNYKAAIGRYQEAIELGPPSASATFKLADAFEKNKQPEQAAVYYREYLRQYPNGAQIADARAALDRLAPALQGASGRVTEAEVARGLEAGESLLAQKNYPAAVERFCDVADVAPGNPRALFRLAQALQATGEFAAAYQNYQAYLKLDPNGDFAAAARREVQRLAPQVQQGKVTSPSSGTRP